MPDHRSNTPPRVTLEDLLQLKRAERPAPEFWAEFERELRQKQLAALVERRSWWHEFAAACSRYRRLRLPLGAIMVVAVTFLSFRYYSQSGSQPPLMTGGTPAHSVIARSAMPPNAHVQPVIAASAATVRAADEQTVASSIQTTALAAESPSTAPTPFSGFVPWVGSVMENPASTFELAPSARTIAANLAPVTAIEPELVDAVARPLGFEERAMPAVRPRHTAEVLPTAAAVTEPRRARLLASLGSAATYAPELSAPEHAKRSVNHYLAQDGWDRTISRLEAEGDRLSIKF